MTRRLVLVNLSNHEEEIFLVRDTLGEVRRIAPGEMIDYHPPRSNDPFEPMVLEITEGLDRHAPGGYRPKTPFTIED